MYLDNTTQAVDISGSCQETCYSHPQQCVYSPQIQEEVIPESLEVSCIEYNII